MLHLLAAAASLVLLLSPAIAQPPDPPIPAAGDDIALARRALETIHPGYDRYTPRAALDEAWDRLAREASQGMNERALYTRLSEITALIRCSHTKVEPSAPWAAWRADAPSYLPLRLGTSAGATVVLASATPDIRPGDEIRSIDGVPSVTLMGRLVSLVPADGFTDESRWFALGGMSDLDDCEFDHFAPFVQPIANPARIEVRAPSESVSRLVDVPLVTRARRAELLGPPAPANLDEAVSLSFPAPGVGLLRIGTFVAYRKNIAPADIYRPLFERLRDEHARTLIIDLRDNGGGSDSAAIDLLRFLLAEPLTISGKAWVRTYRFGDLTDRLETWDRSVLSLPDQAFTPLDNGYFQLNAQPESFDPLLPTFTGRVIALCGPANQSGATLCLAGLRDRRNATLIGEPTGGSVEGPTAGVILFLPLPHSGFKLRIPAIRSVTGLPATPGRGIDPDITVNTTARDLVAKRDPVLDAALREAARPQP
ncbi:MAG: S41 family peptidase [Planctomycetota bacterium]|nr:S41 family peptidase [Planctomycetota bacterium]